MKIEKYELTKKNKYNVYLSSGEVLELDERVITENELLLKKEINKELYSKLEKENKIYNLLAVAEKYISIRLRSIKEMYNYLSKKEEDTDIIDKTINKLIKNGYLDDNIFTKAYIKDKLNFTNWGDYKIKRELSSLGVSQSIIEENSILLEDNILRERMEKIIEKDIRINKKYNGIKLKNKVYNHLLTLGYSKEKVITIINNYEF